MSKPNLKPRDVDLSVLYQSFDFSPNAMNEAWKYNICVKNGKYSSWKLLNTDHPVAFSLSLSLDIYELPESSEIENSIKLIKVKW